MDQAFYIDHVIKKIVHTIFDVNFFSTFILFLLLLYFILDTIMRIPFLLFLKYGPGKTTYLDTFHEVSCIRVITTNKNDNY